MAGDREARIRARAHEIWEMEGRPAGGEKRHWEQAVREIDMEEAKSSPEWSPAAEGGCPVNSFNLSEWAVHHRILVLFLMLLCLAAGVMSYTRLGREEDPDFAVQTMIVQTVWPGATTADTMLQVTDAIEKKLQETPNLDYVKSYTKPGVSVVYVNLLQSLDPADIPWTWYEVRKKVADIKYTLPPGIQGPCLNDEFGAPAAPVTREFA